MQQVIPLAPDNMHVSLISCFFPVLFNPPSFYLGDDAHRRERKLKLRAGHRLHRPNDISNLLLSNTFFCTVQINYNQLFNFLPKVPETSQNPFSSVRWARGLKRTGCNYYLRKPALELACAGWPVEIYETSNSYYYKCVIK